MVQEGDSLWRIADRELGDGHRWQEIFAANHGRRMPDGQLLRDGGDLPGWQPLLPHPTRRPAARHAQARPSIFGPAWRPPGTTTTTGHAVALAGLASTTAEHPDGQHAERRDIVEPPSGSMVGISLAAGTPRRWWWPGAAAMPVASHPPRQSVPLYGDGGDRPAAGLAAACAHPAVDAAGQQPAEPPPGPRVPAHRGIPAIPPWFGSPSPRSTRDEVAVDLAGFGAIAITGAGADGRLRLPVGLLAAATRSRWRCCWSASGSF